MSDAIDAAWSLGGLVADICLRAGLPYQCINVEKLQGTVQGIATVKDNSAGSLVEALSQVFMFDMCDFAGSAQFSIRGSEPIVALTLEDLIDDGKDIDLYKREDTLSVPRVMHLEYTDINGGLTTNKQTSDRSLDSRSRSETTIQSAIMMSADEAATAVTINHKLLVEEQRGELEFSLPDSFLWLTASDVITLEGQRIRLIDKETNDGFQRYKAKHDRQSAYSTVILGVPTPTPTPPNLVVSPSTMQFMDIPIIDDVDDEVGYYIGVSSDSMDWEGAVVDLSRDGGANWVDSDVTELNCIMGEVTTGCGSHSGWYRDDVNELVVELLRNDMELIPATQAEMQNRVNPILVGNELMYFSTAVQLTATSWRIGGFLRGRKGTAISSHAIGERFVFMDRLDITFVSAELFDLGRDLTFRAVSFELTTGTELTATFLSNAQKERAPAYLKARQVASDLVVTWQGVGRLGGGATVRMGQYFIGFRVTLGASTWDTLESTITIPYAAGTLSVRQLNRITGEGPTTSITV